MLPPPLPPPRFNVKKADRRTLTDTLEISLNSQTVPQSLDDLEGHAIKAFQTAAQAAIPLTSQPSRHHRDHWIYSDRVKELNHRLNTARKAFRRRPTSTNRRYLQAVVRHTTAVKQQLRDEAWIKWCRSLDAHSSLGEMWGKLRTVSRPHPPRPPSHPNPRAEAERLSASFAARASPDQLPNNVRETQEELAQHRSALVEEACMREDEADAPFTIRELQRSLKRGGDTAPGADGVTYSMLRHAGLPGERLLLRVINLSWDQGCLPGTWKTAMIQPIPKPKDPTSLRPISLLSCFGKTAERMVLARLKWRTGPLHPSLFAYLPETGATDCLATFLSELQGGHGMAVFIDLEKAFELANPQAILTTLASKGIGGRLLSWVRDFFQGRGASVRFQGEVSTVFRHVQGTPQGSILSPFLFNVLMEGLTEVDYGMGVRLLCYADDLALVFQRRNCFEQAPPALARLEEKCAELGLKINIDKSRVMVFGQRLPERALSLCGHQLAYTASHQYLGVWLDSRLSFATQVRYLRERVATRTNILRALSGRSAAYAGASYRVLRSFYIHAIRSVIDYSAPCLSSLSSALMAKLEVAQNDALRVILSAPRWCRVANLRAESNLPSLHHRILARTASLAAKLVKCRPTLTISNQLVHALQMPVNTAAGRGWVHSAANAVRQLGAQTLVLGGPDLPHPQYHPSPPWKPPLLNFALPCGSPRANSLPAQLLQETLRRLASLRGPHTACYFTDGSVGDNGSAGAAFVHGQQAESMRLTQGASILQAELAAILGALRHASQLPHTNIIINSDSLSALQVLCSGNLSDNKCLHTTILVQAVRLVSQGKSVLLHWVPSHIGLAGNERADQEANIARSLPNITLNVAPSLSKTKALINKSAAHLTRENHRALVVQGSESAGWYSMATNNQPLSIPPATPNPTVLHIRRLRLGFPTYRQTNNEEPAPCSHCLAEQDDPLIHYILECPATTPLHPQDTPDYPDPDIAWQRAAEAVACTPLQTIINVVEEYPPPR